MIPRVYKYRSIDGRENYVCIDERQHCDFFHIYYWCGKRYRKDGVCIGNFKMGVTDWNRIVKEGRITNLYY